MRAELAGFGLLAQVVDHAFAGVLIMTASADPADSSIVYANQTLSEMTGFSVDDLLGSPPSMLLAEPDPAETARWAGELRGGGRIDEDVVGLRKDGSTFPMRIRGSLVLADDGTPYFAGFAQDVSLAREEAERARIAEAELASQHAYYKALIENSLDTIALIGEDGFVKFESPSVVNVLGYEPGELMGRSIFDLVHPDDLAQVMTALQQTLKGAGPPKERARAKHKDGSWRWMEATINNRLDDPTISAIVLSIRDISDRVVTEETLRSAEERFRTLVERLPMVTYIWEFDPVESGPDAPCYASPQIEGLIGYTPEEWNEDPDLWIGLIHPDDRDRVVRASEEAERSGEPFVAEYRTFHKDGHALWVHDEARLLKRRDDGRSWLYQGVMYDISDRIEADRALRESLERFEALASQAPIGIFQTDAVGRCHYVNEAWCEIAGMPLGQALGNGWAEALHPDDRAWVYEEWNAAMSERRVFSGEYRFLRGNGQVRSVQGNAIGIRDDAGELTGYIGVVADITARSLAEQDLRIARAAIEDTTQGVVITEVVEGTERAVIVYLNQAFSAQTGYQPNELIGRPPSILYGPGTDTATEAELWATLEGGQTFEGEVLTYRRDGTSFDRALTVSPIRDDSGRTTHYISISRDVTQEREAEREVRSGLEVLRAADRSNREMLSQLVEAQEHDLSRMAEGIEDRSLQEMTAVRLRLDMLKKSVEDPKQIEALDQFGRSVESAVGRLRGLVSELRPRTLDRDGLADAVREYLGRAIEDGRLESFEVDAGRSRELPDRQRAAAFRLFQEVVSAAVAGGAHRVSVFIEEAGEALSVRIGHDAAPATDTEPASGRVALQERAQLAGGWVDQPEGPAGDSLVGFSMPFEP